MNSEDRIARHERLTKLFARAGRRARRRIGSIEEKIDIIIDFQIATEERFARNEELRAKNEERFEELFAKNEERFAKNEERFQALIEAIKRDRNGHSG
jgi:hypothetical protein